MNVTFQKRLRREYQELFKRPPEGISLDEGTMEDSLDE